MEIKLLITNIFITNLDFHCRVFNNISRQRYLSTRTEDTSNLGDCRGQTEAKTSSKIRFVFITKRDSPPTLTYLLSLFPGCNCYLARSQGSEEIIDESKKVQIDGNTVSHNATMIQHLTIWGMGESRAWLVNAILWKDSVMERGLTRSTPGDTTTEQRFFLSSKAASLSKNSLRGI